MDIQLEIHSQIALSHAHAQSSRQYASRRHGNLDRTFPRSSLIVPTRSHSIHPIRRVCTQVTVGTCDGMAEDMFRRRCPSIGAAPGAARRRVRRFARARVRRFGTLSLFYDL